MSTKDELRDLFPIQNDRHCVPWTWAEEAYLEYSSRYGSSQSLKRLAERGGFGAAEMIELLVARIQKLKAKGATV